MRGSVDGEKWSNRKLKNCSVTLEGSVSALGIGVGMMNENVKEEKKRKEEKLERKETLT
jgi:hypothetical protein